MDEHLRSIVRKAELSPSFDNVELVRAHYRRAGIPVCACLSSSKEPCVNHSEYGCVSPGDPASHVAPNKYSKTLDYSRSDFLRHLCQACAVEVPLHLHGAVIASGQITDKFQCRCPLCQQMITWARKEAERYLPRLGQHGSQGQGRPLAKLGELVDMSAASSTNARPAEVGIEELAESGIIMAIKLELLPLAKFDAEILSTYYHCNVSMPHLPNSHGRLWLNISLFEYPHLDQIPIVNTD